MANTAVTYQGNGVTTDFAITFDYLARKFVRVDIDGTLQANGVEYNFIDARTISFVSAPAAGTLVTIRRNTPATERIVEFRDASVLKASDLDLSSLQTFHIAEEAKDLVLDTLGTNEDGDLDARFRKIVNLKDGVNPNDAINYGQYTEDREGTYQAALTAKASEVAAKASEVAAKASEGNAKASEVAASASAASASAAAMDAQQSESDTLALKNQTQQIMDTAQGTLDQLAEINALVSEVKGARLPVGVIVSFPEKGDYPGYLYLDGSSFDKATYTQLAAMYPTGILPDLRGASLTGVDDGKGKFTDKVAKALLESQNLSHTHVGTATQGGAHGHTGTATQGGSHGHGVRDTGHSHGIYKGVSGASVDAATITGSTTSRTAVAGVIVSAVTGITINEGGAHTHDVSITEGGAHTHDVTVTATGGTESRPYSYTVYWYIKAADSVGQPEVIQAQDLVARTGVLEGKVSAHETKPDPHPQYTTEVALLWAQKVELAAFTGANQSLAANGYQKLPGGLIIQWGKTTALATGSSPTSSTQTVTMPIAFPNSCFMVDLGTQALSSTNPNAAATLYSFTSSQFTWAADLISGTTSVDIVCHWLAIGY